MLGTELQQFIIEKLVDNKAKDIVSIDIHRKSRITDCMIICTGTSNHYLTEVSEKLIEECRKTGIIPLDVEGQGISDWIIINLCDAIVHIMQENSRQMYEIEKLWVEVEITTDCRC
ncbi:MAG: ribosome silencing factor [Arsenophonus sp. NEOnobi-MAG3]